MSLSLVASDIAPSPTLALNEKARQLREEGEPVIHLGSGEPKNPAPIASILGAATKLKDGDVKYTPTGGIPSLKKAIQEYTRQNYNKAVTPANIIVSNGAKQALWNLLYAILNPDDEVIILAPYWVSYPEMVKMVYAKPVVVSPPKGSFQPRIEDVKAAITPKTKAILVNSPNNPSGHVYPESFVRELVEYCEEQKIYYISDDIYHKLIFDGKSWPSPYDYTNVDFEESMVITTNGVSKVYGMTGFRIGWTVAPKALTKIMVNVQAQTTSTASVVVQAAAEGALTGSQTNVDALVTMLENNRDIMMRELSTIEGVRCTAPQGTFYCLADFSAINPDSVELAKCILEKAKVVTIPGVDFGMEGYLRLSICGSVKDIQQGVERIKWAVDPMSPRECYIGEKKAVRDWL